MKNITFLFISLFICIVLQSCEDTQSPSNNPQIYSIIQKDSLVQKEALDTTIETPILRKNNSLVQERDSSKTKVLILPCSNCYTCNTTGYELNPIVENTIKKNSNIEIIKFSHKKFCKKGCSGLKNQEHAKYLLNVSKADFLISTRIYGRCEPYRTDRKGEWTLANSGKDNWGYSIRITNNSTLYKRNIIYVKNLKFFEGIEKHFSENINQVIESLKNK